MLYEVYDISTLVSPWLGNSKINLRDIHLVEK